MSSQPIGILCAILWVGESAFGTATASAQNLLTDLGPGSAFGINNSGQVALDTAIYSNGTLTPYPNGILNGGAPTGFVGAAINASGQVAGQLGGYHAGLYSNGVVTDLGVLIDPEVDGSNALGINDAGTVVGWSVVDNNLDVHGAVFSGGTIADIGVLDSTSGPLQRSEALAVNAGGILTGDSTKEHLLIIGGIGDDITTQDAFLYDHGTWTDLGPGLGDAINAGNEVTGQQYDISTGTTLPGHAFLYANGMMTDLGALTGGTTSIGYAINGAGRIVGSSTVGGVSGTHAFFYNGAMQDINALVGTTDPLRPYVTLTDAHGINDTRLIVANGVDSRTQLQHAYLLQGPWLDVAPGMLSFSSQAIGTVGAAQTVTLTNSGPTPLALGGVSTSANFGQTNNCSASLAPSGSCAVSVTLGPTAAGDLTGVLTVISAGVPITVPLAGVAPIQVKISSSAATTTAGIPVKLTWTVSPGASCMKTGGSVADGWTGAVNAGGTQSVTETTAGTYLYGLSCTAGSQSQSTQASVVAAWPALTVSLTASPTTISSGNSTKLTWTSANAKTCVASGGGTDDSWAGSRATSGSATVTESVVVASALTLTYTLTCSNPGTNQSTPASIKVVLNPPTMSGGGGGALDTWAVMFLTGVAALRRRPRAKLRTPAR